MNRTSRLLRWTMVAGLLGAAPGWAGLTNFVVPPDTPGATPLTPFNAWTNASTNIYQAIAACDTNAGYDTVVVSAGVYALTGTVTLSKGITLRSWKDGEAAPEETILDRGGSGRGCYLNHAAAVMEGFTITNCDPGAVDGGGAYIYTAGGTLRNCRLVGNTGRNGGRAQIYLLNVNPLIGRMERCLVAGNTVSGQGGGVHLPYGGVLEDCTIAENRSGNYGGGIYMDATGTVVRCLIRANTSTNYGGGALFWNKRGTVTGCTLAENEGQARAGGIYFYYGGGPGETVLENSVLVSNRTSGGSAEGGAIFFRGDASNVVVRNCLIAYNTSGNGFGILGAAQKAPPPNQVWNCTIVSNQGTGAAGSALSFASGNQARNTIVCYNQGGTKPNVSLTGTALTGGVEYCCATPLADLGTGACNTASAPGFADTNAGNFRLTAGSLCINAGTNDASWMAAARDLDGRARQDRFSRLVDMGAYEVVPPGVLTILR